MGFGLPPVLLSAAERAFSDAYATRYLSGIGLVLLLYDHALTFIDEVQLVWNAKSSFAKHMFLFNRYLVPVCLLVVAYYMNIYSGPGASALSCRVVFGTTSLIGVSSIGIANVLVLLRVITLWDRDKRIMVVLTIGFVISFLSTFGLMVAALVTLLPTVVYSDMTRICYTPATARLMAGVWASPLLFEVIVMICVCWNAFDRPRGSNTRLTTVLRRDGFIFFLALTSFRILNLVMAAVARPTLILVGVFFVWSMTTLVLSRSLLNIQKAALVRRTGNDAEPWRLSAIPSHPDALGQMTTAERPVSPYTVVELRHDVMRREDSSQASRKSEDEEWEMAVGSPRDRSRWK